MVKIGPDACSLFTGLLHIQKRGSFPGYKILSIFPADYDHAEAEAKHLIHEADVDGDSKLSKEEFMEKYMLFVGSHIDVGEALTKHDEF